MSRQLFVTACMVVVPALTAAMPGGASAPAAQPAAKGAADDGVAAYLTRNGSTVKVPLFSAEASTAAAATVDGDAITVEDLTAALAAAHGGFDRDAAAGKKDFTAILDRLIQIRLLAAESREMGIDELPEVKQAVAEYRRNAGQELLKASVTASVKPDPAQVKRLYRDAVREWKVRSVLIAGEFDAKRLAPQLKAPGAFEAVAKKIVAEKKAKGSPEADFLPRGKMLPQVHTALEKAKVGEVIGPLKVQDGYAILKVEATRYPDDPAAWAEAERRSLKSRQEQKLKDYYGGLVKKFAKIDRKLLASVDYHAAKPGHEALKKDRRVIAAIQGGKPITVGDLTEAMVSGFFHGFERAAKEKKVNGKKDEVFDGLLSQRIIPLQVGAEKLEETREFRRRVAEFERGLLFSKFLEKAVVPRLGLTEEKVRKYHEEHRKEFMYPTFYKVESLAFGSLKGAEDAVKKLRSGTDFKWLNANAEGQIKPAQRKLGVEGILAATALPKDVAASLAGVKKGDYRLHAGPESQYYAIHVVDVIGATEQPFEEVRETITQRLYNDALTGAVDKWASTLRNARPVEVFITRIGS